MSFVFKGNLSCSVLRRCAMTLPRNVVAETFLVSPPGRIY